jgi:hypothetical protein
MTASAKLDALDAAMTPGPWIRRLMADGSHPRVYVSRPMISEDTTTTVPPKFYVAFMPSMSDDTEIPDADSIAALRNALPELMALVAAAENLTLDNDDGPYLGESLEQWEHRIVGTREKQRHNLSAALAALDAKL